MLKSFDQAESVPVQPKLPARNLRNLTSLRFFAALYVILFHFLRPQVAPGLFYSFLNAGEASVSFFFILSGYVLYHAYRGRPLAAKPFLVKRFARIYPAFALALAISFPHFFKETIRPDHGALLAVPVKLAMLHGWVPKFTYAWNYPDWTLSVETFFYLTFPLLLPVVEKLDRLRTMLLIASSILAAWVCMTWLFRPIAELTPWFGLRPLFRLPEFVLGIALCHYVRVAAVTWSRTSVPFLATIAASLVLLVSHDALPPVVYFLLLPIAGSLLVTTGALAPESLMAAPLLVLLGEASYGIYIFHVPVDEVSGMVAAKLHANLRTPLSLAIETLALVSLSVFLHARFEMPVRNWILRQPIFGGKPTVAAG